MSAPAGSREAAQLRARIEALEEENEALRQRLAKAKPKVDPREAIEARWPHLHLRASGYLLLAELMRAEGKTVTHERLMEALYDGRPEHDWPDSETMKVQVYHLRKAMARDGYADRIETVWGVGYALNRVQAPS